MKIKINNIICDSIDEASMREALDWANQRGEYAEIIYVECSPVYGHGSAWDHAVGLNYNGATLDIPQHYTMRNWYNNNRQCTTPIPESEARAFSKELSYEYNCNKIITQIKQDIAAIEATRPTKAD